ncbi:hypothetical protein [Nocardia sp. NPDC003963]
MSESFQVDPDAVRALTEKLRDIATNAARTARELPDALAAAGMTEAAAGWGDDEMGRMFADQYLPSAAECIDALQHSAEALRDMGSLLAESLSAFDEVDAAAGRSVRGDAAVAEPRVPDTGGYPQTGRVSASGNISTAPNHPGGYGPAPDAPVAGPSAIPAADNAVESTTSGPGTQPAADTHRRATDPVAPETGRSGEVGASTGSSVAAGPSAYTPAAPGPASPETRSAPAPRVDQRSAPGARGTARSPWSDNSVAPHPPADRARASAPRDQGGPSRATPPNPPRGASRTNAPAGRADHARPAAGPQRPRTTSPLPPHPSPRPGTSADIMGILDESAARHGFRIIGFDTAGLDETTAREIAGAVDQVLPRHPTVDLRVLEIADLDDARPARLYRPVVSGADRPEIRAAHIVLDRTATTDPATRSGSVEVATAGRRAAPGSAVRPVYATLVRELGRALAAVAGAAVYRQTQRTLITEYLRTTGLGGAGDSRGRTVSGYRHWRDQLSGCSPTTRFDPGIALVEAFTEVELQADRASTPATALHRLLVDTARQRS